MTPQRIRVVTSTVTGVMWGAATVAGTVLFFALVVAAFTTPLWAKLVIVAAVGLASAAVVFPTRVNVSVNERGVRYGRTAGHSRWIPREQLAAVESIPVGAGAVVGVGVRLSEATQRRIVRAGWVLHLSLKSGEEIWLSTRTALDAHEVFPGAESGHDAKDSADSGHAGAVPAPAGDRPTGDREEKTVADRKPWFGSKRVGIGIRPQTWQGWVIVAVGIVVVIVGVRLLTL